MIDPSEIKVEFNTDDLRAECEIVVTAHVEVRHTMKIHPKWQLPIDNEEIEQAKEAAIKELRDRIYGGTIELTPGLEKAIELSHLFKRTMQLGNELTEAG